VAGTDKINNMIIKNACLSSQSLKGDVREFFCSCFFLRFFKIFLV
jgi:hypothetical protein